MAEWKAIQGTKSQFEDSKLDKLKVEGGYIYRLTEFIIVDGKGYRNMSICFGPGEENTFSGDKNVETNKKSDCRRTRTS